MQSKAATLVAKTNFCNIAMDQSCRDIPMRLDINHQPLNFDIYLSQVIDIPRTPSLEVPSYDFSLEKRALEYVDQIIARIQLDEQKSQAALASDNQEDQLKSNVVTSCDLSDLIDQGNPPFYDDTVTTPIAASNIAIDSYKRLTEQSVDQKQDESSGQASQHQNIKSLRDGSKNTLQLAPPTCPVETPLTPIRCFSETNEPTTANSTISSSVSAKSSTTTNCDLSKLATTNHCNPNTDSSQATKDNSRKETSVNQVNPRDFEDIHNDPFDNLELQTIDELRELNLVFQASFANQASKQ